VQTDLEVSDHVWATREGMVAFAGHPLTIEGRVLGVMAVFSRREFSDDTLRMLAVIASVMAHGINRQWLDEDRRLLQVKTEAALKAAERSNEALQRFAAIASHDLQEPVRQVTAFSTMLAKRYQDRFDAEGQQYMDFIVDGAKRMGRLIQGLLAYSQIEAMTTTPMETADTEHALTEATHNLALAIQDAGALITHDALPSLTGNQEQLAQLFLNLINNALKYRSTAPPHIHISATRSSHEWIFSVRDNGTGIPPEQRAKIFGVFIRLHGREIAGVGLGLAFCTKIVALHGGHIWVDGNPDGENGSVFRFTLPA
jgi:light-regulated signal transduction histidine kinase (bacteriophytochrome)